jgi:conjugal transfer pilus assembly protein TraL
MQSDTYIPRRLDDSWKIGFWDAEVALPVLFMLMIGYASGSKLGFAVCLVIGIAISRWFSRMKADKHQAFALHWLFWHLPTTPLTAMRVTPPSCIRRMVG